jgi:hypothetical protein
MYNYTRNECSFIPVQVRYQLVLVMPHASPEVGDLARVRLPGNPQIRLRDENVTHGQHTKATWKKHTRNEWGRW